MGGSQSSSTAKPLLPGAGFKADGSKPVAYDSTPHAENSAEQGTFTLKASAAIGGSAWVVFSVVCLLFGLTYHNSQAEIWCLVCLGAVGLSMMAITAQSAGDTKQLTFALWLLASLILGAAVGLCAYDFCIAEYWHSQKLAARENVLPSEDANAYRDVGKIVFADEARVDASRSVGYMDSSTYCVAPVASDAPMDKVQFWAAGVDCCGSRGSFTCDDSWNPKAHGGVVINPGFNTIIGPDVHAQYLKAIKLAEVTYAVASAEEPILVRWVADPDKVELNIWTAGLGVVLGAIIIAAFACFLQVLLMSGQCEKQMSCWTRK